MQMRYVALIVACLAHGCAQSAGKLPKEDFTLCNATPPAKETITVEYENLIGTISDQGRHLTRCEGSNTACLEYPLTISAPPRLPKKSLERVNWIEGDKTFSIGFLPGSDSTYLMEVVQPARGAYAGKTPDWKAFYTYEAEEGVTSFRAVGANEFWIRCEGRLTFDDLRAIGERLAAVENSTSRDR